MADYRDDRRALRFERDRLVEDLQRAEQTLESQDAQLDAQRARIAALERQLAAPTTPPTQPSAPIAWDCAACGKGNEAHYRFCLGCGATRPESGASTAIPPGDAPAAGAWSRPPVARSKHVPIWLIVTIAALVAGIVVWVVGGGAFG